MRVSFFSKKFLLIYYFVFSFIASNVFYLLYKNGFFEKSELATIEFRFNNIKKKFPLNNIYIIKIDDYSIKKYGTPLPRDLYGYLLLKARENGAKSVSFDLMFPSFNENDLKDLYFLQNMSDFKNTILAAYISTDKNGFLMQSNEVFRNYSSGEGFINMFRGKDIVLFGSKLIYDTGKGSYVPSLAVETYAKAFGIDDIDSYIAKNYTLYNGDLLINYAGGKETFPSSSISDLLDPKFDFSILKNKIILVGATYATSQDFYMTPFHGSGKYGASAVSTPGVEIHANILNTLINKNELKRKPYSYWSFMAGAVIITLLFVPVFSFVNLIVPLTVLITLLTSAAYFAFINNYIFEIVPFLLLLILTYIASISFKIIFETLEKNRIQGIFGKYLAPEVVKQLVDSQKEIAVGGVTKNISIFFSDVADFTTISEKVPPDKLVHLLNEYFNKMVSIITKNNGIIDKYIGDAIMALFGTPIERDDHADLVLTSAIEMRKSIDSLKPQWLEAAGVDFNARIGINSGEVVVGNIGSDKMIQYTAIGDNVNLASRLEGVNKYFGTNIIISENTYALLKDKNKYLLRELDLLRVKGKALPVMIYEAVGFNTPENSHWIPLLATFKKGLDLYKNKFFSEALNVFLSLPQDEPSQVYAERCRNFIASPPPENWDKVFTLSSK